MGCLFSAVDTLLSHINSRSCGGSAELLRKTKRVSNILSGAKMGEVYNDKCVEDTKEIGTKLRN